MNDNFILNNIKEEILGHFKVIYKNAPMYGKFKPLFWLMSRKSLKALKKECGLCLQEALIMSFMYEQKSSYTTYKEMFDYFNVNTKEKHKLYVFIKDLSKNFYLLNRHPVKKIVNDVLSADNTDKIVMHIDKEDYLDNFEVYVNNIEYLMRAPFKRFTGDDSEENFIAFLGYFIRNIAAYGFDFNKWSFDFIYILRHMDSNARDYDLAKWIKEFYWENIEIKETSKQNKYFGLTFYLACLYLDNSYDNIFYNTEKYIPFTLVEEFCNFIGIPYCRFIKDNNYIFNVNLASITKNEVKRDYKYIEIKSSVFANIIKNTRLSKKLLERLEKIEISSKAEKDNPSEIKENDDIDITKTELTYDEKANEWKPKEKDIIGDFIKEITDNVYNNWCFANKANNENKSVDWIVFSPNDVYSQTNSNNTAKEDPENEYYYISDILNLSKCEIAKVIYPSDITEKTLFFSEKQNAQIENFKKLINEDGFSKVRERMVEKGMRTGFASLLYGAPGTGKTELVKQLARETNRPVIIADISEIRSKYVGDSAKNVKYLFDMYRDVVKKSQSLSKLTPILLLNEADGIIGTRTNIDNSNNASVDVDNNQMVNVFLQEIEDLDGILIATTNFAGNLDEAFERRFLFKIEFEKPDMETRMKIWNSMIPNLNDDECKALAKEYDFSGGEIENISRKYDIDYILYGTEISLEKLREICDNEKIHDKKKIKIGFNVTNINMKKIS